MAAKQDIRNANEYVLYLQRHGRYTFSEAEFQSALGLSESAADQALRRLVERKGAVPLRREFYSVVPPQYSGVGAAPATWFIDDLMRYLDQPYYVALLVAASFYGAAHQQPMVFQVMTDRRTRPVHAGRNRIEFHIRRDIENASTTRLQTETGYLTVSTPETTAFDLIRNPRSSGGLSNVATVLIELEERLDPEALVREAAVRRVPEIQRLGYLLDSLSLSEVACKLRMSLEGRRVRPVLLQPGECMRHEPMFSGEPWQVIVNTEVEPDDL